MSGFSVAASLVQQAVAATQLAVPPRPSRIGWVSQPDVSDSAFHLFRHVLLTRPGLEHVWFVEHDDALSRRRIDELLERCPRGSSVEVVPRRSARGFVRMLRCRWVFHTHGIYRAVRSAHRRHIVSLWHGMQVKLVGRRDNTSADTWTAYGSLHLATSEMYRTEVSRSFAVDPGQVLVTALPRTDVLTAPLAGVASADLRPGLGLPADRRVVLWLPTFRDSPLHRSRERGAYGPRSFLDDLEEGAVEELATAARDAGSTVVIKVHPMDPLNERPPSGLPSGLRLVTANEWRELGLDLYDALARCQGLISDVSSVLVDALASGLPIGLFGFDPRRYRRQLCFPIERLTTSTRMDDLSQPDEREAFFARVGGTLPPAEDDLSAWLHSAPPGSGCETVLEAVGLGGRTSASSAE